MTDILHVGLGPLGRRILEDFHRRKLGSIRAVVDRDETLAGTPLGDHVPFAASHPIAASIEELGDLAGVGCAVVTTGSRLPDCAPTFRALLSRGINVVSSCEELLYPWLRHAGLAAELDEFARAHDARILGTGINPGFLMDCLPVMVTAVCHSVRSVEAHRIQDASSRRIPFQRKIGATLDRAAFDAAIEAGTLQHVGLGESLHFVAHYLEIPIDSWTESIEPVMATEELECGIGTIRPGQATGVRQEAEGWHGEERVVRLVFQAAIGQSQPHDRVIVRGDPPLDVMLIGGVQGDIGTSAVVLNSIAPLLDATPGLHTMATIRPAHARWGS